MNTSQSLIGDVVLRRYENENAMSKTDEVIGTYAEVYAEPPYNEGEDAVTEFAYGWPKRITQPGFRLVCAELDETVIGMSFGHRLTPETKWWHGAVESLPRELTDEWSGRTFAIIELAVLAPYRRHGIGRALHDALLDGRHEERVTLLSLREAEAAQRAYLRWGYRRVGQIKPGVDTPTYDALIRSLN